jgi:acetate---CoA ligase (ADP-forming)
MKSNLDRLFDPRAVAVIGASSRVDSIGRIVLKNLLASGRPTYPVHPVETSILGCAVTRDIADLPGNVDLAVITTGAASAVRAAEDCGRKGISFVIVLAGGFGEVGEGGKDLEKQLRRVTDEHRTRILGPNTLGLFAPRERLDTIFVEHGDKALGLGGGVAFVSQSGSVGVESLGIESNIGFGLRAFVGLGNKVDLDEVDFLDYFAGDPDTRCVALYTESFSQGRLFLEAAKRVSRQKPVVLLKAGRTKSGAAAVSSHTGSLAGQDLILNGVFRQYGIQRVFDEEQLCDAARVLAMERLPEGNRVAVMSPAGGYGIMAADEIETGQNTPLTMARLSGETENAIRMKLPGFASIRNPVDLTTAATDDITIGVLSELIKDAGVDIILVVAFFAPVGMSDALIRKMAGVVQGSPKPVIVVSQFGPFTDGHISRFFDYGVIAYPSVVRGVRAVRWLVERSKVVTGFTA